MSPNVPSRLRGDPGRLQQVLLNLIGNAVKFTAKGKVSVSVCLDREDEQSATLRFSVRDTGIGIPADRRSRLFLPFTQVDGSVSRQFGGTGLGLAISKQLVDLLGGEIGVESELGVSSTFWFTAVFKKPPVAPPIPAEMPGLPRERPERRTPEPRTRPVRVLVAEDNVVNQLLASRILEKAGHSVAIANNGREVLAWLQTEAFDMVLMDVQMPVMDGLEATRAIRRSEAGKGTHLPIIAMTAHAMTGDRKACLAAGMDDYISKPIRPAELLYLVAKDHAGEPGA
jgi:CheY-like chemotaxis protein/anti-sigma regulatory factor (Ser/Thr protein kinase)